MFRFARGVTLMLGRPRTAQGAAFSERREGSVGLRMGRRGGGGAPGDQRAWTPPSCPSDCGGLEGKITLSRDGFPEGVAPSPPLPPRPARLALLRVRSLPSFAVLLFWPPPVQPPHLSSGPSSKHPDLTTSNPHPEAGGLQSEAAPREDRPVPSRQELPKLPSPQAPLPQLGTGGS